MLFLRYGIILVQIRNFLPTLPYLTPRGGEPRQNFLTILGMEKLMGLPEAQKRYKIGLAV